MKTSIKLLSVVLAIVVSLNFVACSDDEELVLPSNDSFTTPTYDYVWPSDLSGYKIRMTDTYFVKEDRLFQEYLQAGYSNAFVYVFITNNTHEIYGYESSNAKYTSDGYTKSDGTALNGKSYLAISMDYTYVDNGVVLAGTDNCDLNPTSAEAGVYMCWGKYPGLNPLYDAKTGTYEIVIDPSTGYVE